MASTKQCAYCGGALRSDQKTCPGCGAKNPGYIEDSKRTIYKPKTIAELKEYCAERGMPLQRMRFFIDEDYRNPKAFGIYREGDNFVVYKNKADGSRAVRYRGPDEAHAVRELHEKLVAECRQRGIDPDAAGSVRKAMDLPKVPEPKVQGGFAKVVYYILALGPLLAAPWAILILLLGRLLSKKIKRRERAWPAERERTEEPYLNKAIRPAEQRRYFLNVMRYGVPTDASLSSRERQIKHSGSFWSSLPNRIPSLIAVLLVWISAVLCLVNNDRQKADISSFDSGYYQTGDGRLYYHDDYLVNFNSERYDYDYSKDRIWFVTDADGSSDWTLYEGKRLTGSDGKLLANNHMKRWYLGPDWKSSFGGSDFKESWFEKAHQLYLEASIGDFREGYYRFDDQRLYYRSDRYSWPDWHWCKLPEGKVWYDDTNLMRLDGVVPLTPDAATEYFLGGGWTEDMGGCDYLIFTESQKASSYPKGYYRMKNGELYYNSGSSWYEERSYGWSYAGTSLDEYDGAFDSSSYSGYYLDEEWDTDWGGQSYDSWYDSTRSSSTSSDSSSSSDYDSWDSSDTDWDSDW